MVDGNASTISVEHNLLLGFPVICAAGLPVHHPAMRADPINFVQLPLFPLLYPMLDHFLPSRERRLHLDRGTQTTAHRLAHEFGQ